MLALHSCNLAFMHPTTHKHTHTSHKSMRETKARNTWHKIVLCMHGTAWLEDETEGWILRRAIKGACHGFDQYLYHTRRPVSCSSMTHCHMMTNHDAPPNLMQTPACKHRHANTGMQTEAERLQRVLRPLIMS